MFCEGFVVDGEGFCRGDELDAALLERVRSYLDLRARRRDPGPVLGESWATFYRCLAPGLLSLAAATAHPGEDPQDVVQEIWLAILIRLPRFQLDPQRGSVRDWLRVVARHVLIDHSRVKRGHATVYLDARLSEHVAASDPDPSAASEIRDDAHLVHQALATLREQVSEKDYQLLVEHWVGGKSLVAIAAEIGLAPRQVRKRHCRLLHQLHEFLIKSSYCPRTVRG